MYLNVKGMWETGISLKHSPFGIFGGQNDTGCSNGPTSVFFLTINMPVLHVHLSPPRTCAEGPTSQRVVRYEFGPRTN